MKLADKIRFARDFLEVKRCRKNMLAPRALLFPVLWITGKCNLKCKMCDQWLEGERHGDELTTQEWFRVIDSACRLKALVILVTGGEPFLRNDIFELLNYINKKGISSHLCSNGTLINEEVIRGLRSSGLNSISISLDSYDSKVFNEIRKENVFDDVVNNIRLLRKGLPGIKIGINCLISKINFRDICKIVPFVESLGVDQIKFDIVHNHLGHCKNKGCNSEELFFSKNELPELKKEIDKLRKDLFKSRLLTNSDTFLKGIVSASEGKTNKLECFAGYISCCIDPYGKVTPCDNGNTGMDLRKIKLEEIWSSKEFQRFRDNVGDCSLSCWDSTHAEMNIRCSRFGVFKELKQVIREFNYYC